MTLPAASGRSAADPPRDGGGGHSADTIRRGAHLWAMASTDPPESLELPLSRSGRRDNFAFFLL